MDKQLHTPEEELYLRMLDREVPDLWGRIEAGLDKAEAEQNRAESREQRFLASQEGGQIVSFPQGQGQNVNKKRRVGLIIGIAAAAVVVIGSVTIYGFSKRNAGKSESKQDFSGLAESEMTIEEAGEPAEDRKDSLDFQGKQQEVHQSQSMKGDSNYAIPDIAEEDEPVEDYQGSVPAAEEMPATESAADAGAEATNEGKDRDGSGSVNYYLAPSSVSTKQLNLGSMMALEGEHGIVRIFRNVDGKMKAYRFFGKDEAGQVLLLEEDIFLSNANAEEKRQDAIAFDPEQKLKIGDVEGEISFILPE